MTSSHDDKLVAVMRAVLRLPIERQRAASGWGLTGNSTGRPYASYLRRTGRASDRRSTGRASDRRSTGRPCASDRRGIPRQQSRYRRMALQLFKIGDRRGEWH